MDDVNKHTKAENDRHEEIPEYTRRLETYNAVLKSANRKLSAELQSVYGSRSWKLTAPLRFAASCIRKTLNRKGTFSFLASVPVWPPEVKALEKKWAPDKQSLPCTMACGVFMHIFYVELAEEMLDLFGHLPSNSRLHISTDSEEKREKLLSLCVRRGIDHRTEVRICPNSGWDMAPFFIGFADKILRYPLILRLHSKRSEQLPEKVGVSWRHMLFSSLCGSKARVNAIMRAFADDPQLGMICPPTVAYYINNIHFGGNFERMRKLLAPHGIAIHENTPIDFPVGAMFWCRPQTLAPWLNENFAYQDFENTGADKRDGSLAHALERLLLFGCGIAGYHWARVPE